jgi:hypothetical protein
MVESIESSTGINDSNTKIVDHETDGSDQVRFGVEEVSDATEQGIGAAAEPEAEERVVERLGEMVGEREEAEPGQPDQERGEVGPEIADIVVPHQSVGQTLGERGVGLAIATHNEWFSVCSRHLTARVRRQTTQPGLGTVNCCSISSHLLHLGTRLSLLGTWQLLNNAL